MTRTTPPRPLTLQSGFTLIELITVMVIVSILGVMGSQFVVSTLDSYNSTVNRGKLIAHGRQALERMTRQLRGALPNSVRITNANQCVEFLPIAGGGHYINSLPDADNGAAGVTSFTTGGYEVSFGSARYVYVGALSAAEIYGGSAAGVNLASTLAEGASGVVVNLTGLHQFLRNSITRRFFLVDDPQAFCLIGGELRFFSGYATPLTSGGVPTGAGVLMAELVTGNGAPFSLSLGSEDRNSVLSIRLGFGAGTESIVLNQEVFIRNVP